MIDAARTTRRRRRTGGFTLIELLIALVVAGVLVGVAVPGYQSYIRAAYRAEARVALLEASQWLERHFSLTQSYALSAQGLPIDNAALEAAGLAVRPTSGAPRYRLSFVGSPTQTTFTLQAVPTGSQVADTRCGTLTLTHLQERGVSGRGTVADCWAR